MGYQSRQDPSFHYAIQIPVPTPCFPSGPHDAGLECLNTANLVLIGETLCLSSDPSLLPPARSLGLSGRHVASTDNRHQDYIGSPAGRGLLCLRDLLRLILHLGYHVIDGLLEVGVAGPLTLSIGWSASGSEVRRLLTDRDQIGPVDGLERERTMRGDWTDGGTTERSGDVHSPRLDLLGHL